MINYEWTVVYKDDSVVKQQKDNGEEIPFSELVLEEIKEFTLETKKDFKIKKFSVDLDSGLFKLNDITLGLTLNFGEAYKKLIYFRRRREDISAHGRKSFSMPVLGYQVTFEGKAYKYMYMLAPDGNMLARYYDKGEK